MKNLLINLLIKFGLLKINETEYFNMFVRLHDELPKVWLKNKKLNNAEYNNAICEIKMFFLVIAAPILEEDLPLELVDKTMKLYRSNIIFSTIDKHQYSEEYMSNLLQTRLDFHKNGIAAIGSSSITNNYFQELKVLFFEQPFIDITELSQNNMHNWDPYSTVYEQTEGLLIFNHMVPSYVKSLKKLTKLIKNNIA